MINLSWVWVLSSALLLWLYQQWKIQMTSYPEGIGMVLTSTGLRERRLLLKVKTNIILRFFWATEWLDFFVPFCSCRLLLQMQCLVHRDILWAERQPVFLQPVSLRWHVHRGQRGLCVSLQRIIYRSEVGGALLLLSVEGWNFLQCLRFIYRITLVFCCAVLLCSKSVMLMPPSPSSSRCQLSPYCKDEPCKNGGTCFDSLDGAVCQCDSGFRGER